MSRSVIVSFARTPIAKFRGSLASVPAPALGAVAIKGAVARTQIENLDVVEAFMGNVVSAGIGQGTFVGNCVF
jgi:acetyl-CoA C-acetyltransferase